MKQLYNEGVNWKMRDKWGRSPLSAASQYGHVDIVKFLIGLGAEVNHQDEGQYVEPSYACLRGAV